MKRLFYLFIICFLNQNLSSQLVVELVQKNILVDKGIQFLEDRTGTLTINEVIGSEDFKPVNNTVPNFGISASTYWLKINIYSKVKNENIRLQVPQPNLDEIDFYRYNIDGEHEVLKGGEHLPFNQREFFDPGFIYKINLDSGKVNTYYLRIKSRDNFQVPVILGSSESIFESNKIRDFILGIFSGIMVVMFLYNSFLYVTVKDKTYLYYIIYLATVIFTQVSIQGYTFQYLWPNSSFMAQWSPFIFSPLVGIFSAVFMRVFLRTAYFIPKFDKGFIYFFILYAIAFALSLFGQFQTSYLLITLSASLLSMYMMIGAVVVYRKNYRPAGFFLIAWSIFLFGVTIYAMTNLGILPINNFTFYTMPLGAATEVVLLSLALADRINILKKEKEASQAEALKVSEENQKLVTEQNVMLEQKVHMRTLELEETNEELNVTLTYLKDTQTQLVNAEKMASLGQLTAGIAHEINNPINFVSANLKPLKMDITEVFDVLNKYKEITTASELENKLKEIDQFKKKIDLDYIETEIGSLLKGIEDGARRTTEIVSGLKNFSRLDESELKEADINEGIESTIILVRSTISDNVELITNLSELPLIECYPGKLNQVFMNLLTNSIYAVKQKPFSEKQKINITTFEKDDKIYAVFEDTGTGMTKEVKEKIFEPFFTTKDVGEGTGLGMSIVFKIIESHSAKMEVESQPGTGTKMTLILNKKLKGLH
jgi:two-component system, NtrC family, sensor kinase